MCLVLQQERGFIRCLRVRMFASWRDSLYEKFASSKIAIQRQKAAFPPNFVHSLDSSHMMMTAIACKESGLHFVGVRNSFWVHACDVDKMNQILIEQFVELYNMPILDNLLEEFQTSFPTLKFPPCPAQGNFNVREVLTSTYFFN